MLKITNDTEIENFHDIPGVYAYFNGGYITDNDDYIKDHKKDAIGVAVISEVEGKLHRIVIDKTNIGGKTYFGGYNKFISGATTPRYVATALKDMNGKTNTIAISKACREYFDNLRIGSVAEDCQKRFDGKGYLPSIGEWQMLYDNKDEVDKMMSIIGGEAIRKSWYWSSTLYNASTYSRLFHWPNGYTDATYRSYGYYVRAVMEF